MKKQQIELGIAYRDWRRKSRDTENFMSCQSEFRLAGRLDLFEQKYETMYRAEMKAFERYRDLRDKI